MAGALGVGPGVLVLLVLWAMALLLVLALVRAGRARVAAVPVVLGAAALTAALLLLPREGESAAPGGAEEIVDTFLIGRFILLAVMSLVFLGCLFLFLIYHLMEPVYAKPLHRS
ncbi:transmembrane protein 218 [Catharus ustulatus]|uniref:transmembrane protein 218 n=1 Tax=Catharus ustulatus TaxID=91951 RepID=UPI00140A996E|nr:transmembrane protein 218 [Catharus ustulatus]